MRSEKRGNKIGVVSERYDADKELKKVRL